MSKKKKKHTFKKLRNRWVSQIVSTSKLKRAIPNYIHYFKDMKKYSKMEGAEPIKFINTMPFIHERTATTSFSKQYFYQDIWAFKKIYESRFDSHLDIGSRIDYVGLLSVIKKMTFIDIRPLVVNLENLESKKGNILNMPYPDNSINSISCLNVAEHIGLGRYGDPLDPYGTKKAAKELTRILALGGNLYFSLPIGKPLVYFNGLRVHSTHQILEYFSELDLLEISGVDDQGNFIVNVDPEVLNQCIYGCGFFWFTKSKNEKV